MRSAGAEPADNERHKQKRKARARASETIAKPRQRSPAGQYDRRAQTFSNEPGGDLKRRHGAGEQTAHQAKLAIAEPEFGLPDRQHHDDEIGVAVMQGMRAAGDTSGAALFAPRLGLFDRLAARNRHDRPS